MAFSGLSIVLNLILKNKIIRGSRRGVKEETKSVLPDTESTVGVCVCG